METKALMFEQQPRESNKAFAAFSLYLSMGPERSIREVGKRLGKSEGLIERWASKFEWRSRVAAHGAYLSLVEREAIEARARSKAVEWEKRKQELKETEWAMHERAIAAAKRALDAFMEREKVYANLADIARMLEVASKMGRLATGLDMDGEKQSGGDVPVRVEVTLALEKIYGEPLPGEVIDVTPQEKAESEKAESGKHLTLGPSPQSGEGKLP